MSGRTRRPHGDGSVFPYRGGFAAVLDLGWSEGKRRRKWVYGKTEAEVMAKFNAAKRIRQDGHSLLARPRSFGEWLDEWLQLKEREGTRPLTLKSYRWLIEYHPPADTRPGATGEADPDDDPAAVGGQD